MPQTIEVDTSKMELFLGTEEEHPFIDGRRDYLKWRDLGMRGPTDNFLRAEIISKVPGVVTGNPWHYHPDPCIGQFFLVLSGWNEVAYEDGTVRRMEAGDAGWMPGSIRHRQIRMSEDFTVLEISFPGTIETIECERPTTAAAVEDPSDLGRP